MPELSQFSYCQLQLPPAGVSNRRSTVQEAVAGVDASTIDPPGTGRRLTGPQSWYATAHGPPADQLPKGDVGPHLPPGETVDAS